MKLQQLASKPQLIPILIDDEDTVEEFGEALEFYIYDRQPMEVFMRLASLEAENSFVDLAAIVESMIMDSEGQRILTNDITLPMNVMIKVIEVTVNRLGNTKPQTSKG
jgi:hypothetical protein